MECLRCKHVDVVSRLLPELGSGDRLSPTAELNAEINSSFQSSGTRRLGALDVAYQ
jgi:hypothetical protein